MMKNGNDFEPGFDAAHGRSEFFPTTQIDWIRSQLLQGDAGATAIRRHVMVVYYEPLQKYFNATSFRGSGESQDVVSGFFASRFSNPSYVEQWLESAKPLRRWLINGFLFYLHEMNRSRARSERSDVVLNDDVFIHRAEIFEIEWARTIVRLAADRARQECERRGLVENWRMFEQHHLKGRPYRVLAEERKMSPRRAAE
ncbi:hypothetical protein N9411_00670, partial [bacterium]|nr:hypothetical protein [bacterium]